MAKFKMHLDGIDEVQKDFRDFSFSGQRALPRFLDLISQEALSLLRQNTPKDTGELSESWGVIERGMNYVVLGVPDEQEGLLQALLFGTSEHDILAKPGSALSTPFGAFKKVRVRGITPNNFVANIDSFINEMIYQTMGSVLGKEHRFWTPSAGIGNLGKIVGETGARYNRRRSFGRTNLFRPRTGLLSSRVRIGRRRRVGSAIRTKKVELG